MRCNLASVLFPFATELWGRSIIVPQYDQNYDRTTLNAPGVIIDKGIPQVFYMHNCMPTSQGYQAIGYNQPIAGLPGHTDFDQALPIYSVNGKKALFVPAAGQNYISDGMNVAWTSISPTAGVGLTTQVTTAEVNGITYICYAGVGIFTYDEVGRVLNTITLTGITTTAVQSICEANGYMIAATTTFVAWSNLSNPTDFVPNLSTGAGGGNLNFAKGPITAVLSIAGGFLAYCQDNVVSASYSGNTQFPYTFLEIPGSGGVSNIKDTSWHTNLPNHVAWTGDGIQQLAAGSAIPIFPEANDFLSAMMFEDYDEPTMVFTVTYLTQPLITAINIVEARYVVLSYGVNDIATHNPPTFTYALIYDLNLKRWGKLKITHTMCFEFNFPGTPGNPGIDIYKQGLCFIAPDGTVNQVNFNFSEATADGVLVCGKFQFNRNDRIEHQSCAVDTIDNTNTFNYYVIPSLDGKTLGTPVPGYLAIEGPKTRTYLKLVEGLSVSSMFTGSFNLVSFMLNFTVGGTA